MMQDAADKEAVRLSVIAAQPVNMDRDGLLARPMVVAAISERVNEIVADSELSPARIIREYLALAFSNIGDYIDMHDPTMPQYDLTKCTPEQLAAIKKITFETNSLGASRAIVELHDKLKPLETLAKFVGLVEPDNPHWRAMNATPVIDSGATVAQAADAYAMLLGE